MTTLKERRGITIRKALKPYAGTMRAWYLDTAMDFMCSRKLSDTEEAFFEDLTDFYLSALEDLEKYAVGDKICSFLQRAVNEDLAQKTEMLYNMNHKEQTNNAE